ncbi:MAG: hypothetical protein REH83_07465 [Rickettsiella sp.]|nr:hypothetical protein [Rickettsiella sp.]
MFSFSSLAFLAPRDSQKIKLKELLYKENYCLCIADPHEVKVLFSQLDPAWIKTFLLQKNPLGFSIISMHILIFIKNKSLNSKECKQLLSLLNLLLYQLEPSSINQVQYESGELTDYKCIINYLSYELLQLQLQPMYSQSTAQLVRKQMMEQCQMFLASASKTVCVEVYDERTPLLPEKRNR